MGRRVGLLLAITAVGLLAFAAGSAVTPRPAVAAADREAKPAPRVGFVLLAKVLREARKANKLGGDLNAWRAGLMEKVNTLKAEVDEKQKAVVTAKFEEKDKLQEEIVAARRQMEDIDRGAQKEFQVRSQKVLLAVYKDVNLTTAEIARDFGLDAVVAFPADPNTVNPAEIEQLLRTPGAIPLFVDKGCDFTAELLKRMNQKFEDEGGG
jgi:Skp family chaperone for outer membrane proteins